MPDEKDPDETEDTPAGTEPTGACAACGMQNEQDSKFCDQCGASMAAPQLDSDEDDKPPPSSKEKPGDARAVKAPKPMSTEASLASILGATSESLPALKTAAIGLRQIRDAAAGVFAKENPREIVGELLVVPERLAAGERAAKAAAEQTKKADKDERWSLAHRLNKLGLTGRPRSTIFVDNVDANGKRTATSLQQEYARMDLDVFRGLVAGLEKSAPAARRTPFDADPDRAREASAERAAAEGVGKGAPKLVDGAPTKAQIELAKTAPAVLTQFNRPGNRFSLESIAIEHVRTCASLGMPIRGAA
jgi:hypothetical protein